jgi:hypothetical protein
MSKQTYVYKAKCSSILKIGAIPIELQEDVIFHCHIDILSLGVDVKLNDFEELIDNEWIGLDILKERRNYYNETYGGQDEN